MYDNDRIVETKRGMIEKFLKRRSTKVRVKFMQNTRSRVTNLTTTGRVGVWCFFKETVKKL